MTSYQKIQSFLQQANPRYGDLLTEYRTEQKLLQSIRTRLGAPLGDHCIAIAREGQGLTLYCDSPTWHNRLRLQTPQLLHYLRGLGLHYRTIGCKTVSAKRGEVVRHRPATALRIPPDAAQQMRGLADSLDDPQLSAALRRLSRRGPA